MSRHLVRRSFLTAIALATAVSEDGSPELVEGAKADALPDAGGN
ncbi:MAG: hypothetical protein NTV04_00205 [Deltaproteobacteria bacterium]|nr:hypothetical protein [Deltaproteobacteria bacterium]